ncbi:MAG: hypothetical protein MR270_02605 [Erysipelotrichaceae bacterium]|nr:hypothetical protein [Erysipelotrichaceae bacterium]
MVAIIIALIKIFFTKSKSNDAPKKKFLLRKTYMICLLLIAVIFSTTEIWGRLKYGIYLLHEEPQDALVVEGEIENIVTIKNPQYHTYKSIKGEEFEKYSNLERDAQIITISGNDYYFMIKGDLMVGDYVKISYLPKSTIVLEVTIIYSEELTIN